MEKRAKRLPYGVSNFASFRNEDLYYVDKTKFIYELEEVGDYNLMCRPRRFGKSLFVSMMEAYYDKNMDSRFDELFGGLWIGSHPTEWQGKFQVLSLDFSCVGGDVTDFADHFDAYCRVQLDNFMYWYAADYPDDVREEFFAAKSAYQKIYILEPAVKRLGLHLYLIIDEYDSFVNEVLREQGEAAFRAIDQADNLYCGIFRLFKGMFKRVFITGVSPVLLMDLAESFSLHYDLSLWARMNEMYGFTTDEVREMVAYYKEAGELPADRPSADILSEMRQWYGNYCFSEDGTESRVFNPTMVINYLQDYTAQGEPPDDMIDTNTVVSYRGICRLLQLDTQWKIRKHILREITEEGQIYSSVERLMFARDLKDGDKFISMLYYFGLLTIDGMRGLTPVLAIPNNTVRWQYYGYMLEMHEHLTKISRYGLEVPITYMACDADRQTLLGSIGEAYGRLSADGDIEEGEKSLQCLFKSCLSLNPYYLTAPEVEVAHGFCDFFLMPDLRRYAVSHSYILELKYLPKKDFAARAAAQWDEAVAQINHYAEAPKVKTMTAGTELHKIIMQFEGWALRRMEEV